MTTEENRAEAERVNVLAFRLCEEWQASLHRRAFFTIDELSAFMAGVVAAEVEREKSQRTCATCNAVLADGPQPAATYRALGIGKHGGAG